MNEKRERDSEQLIVTGWYKPFRGLGPLYALRNEGRPGGQNTIYAQPGHRSGCSGADGHGTP